MRTPTAEVFGKRLFTLGILVSVACSPAAPSPVVPATSASQAPPPSPIAPKELAETPASLRTGGLPPVEHPGTVRAEVVARFADDRFETLALDIVLPLSGAFDWAERAGARVSLELHAAGPYAFASIPEDVAAVEGHGLGAATIWVRRARQDEGKPIQGAIYTPQLGADPGHKVSFSAPADAKVKSDPKVVGRWAAAFVTHLREIGTGPWNQFAASRVDEIWGAPKKKTREPAPSVSRIGGDFSRLMETTTGLLSVQEALQHDRPLLLAVSKEKRSVPIGKLAPPKTVRHPWDELLRTVPAPSNEPLATAVPAEFWYARSSHWQSATGLVSLLERFGPKVSALTERRLEERDLEARYATQLGLARKVLGAGIHPGFGEDVLGAVAFTGSDPYLREGSDLTAIFQVQQEALFRVALDAMLAAHAAAHGSPPTVTVTHGGVPIAVTTSRDGALRQHRATIGKLTVVSNSLAATRRVLDAISGKAARLADEKDFRYMLARDADAPLLLFFGDRFVEEVIGPRQKILEARRQMAAAELMAPGFSALLHGWIFGKRPASVDELVSSKLLRKEELKHASGAAIEWRPGEAAQSSWGTPAFLTPLVDLPPPDMVTESERAAYDHFSRTYQTYWSRYVDPTAIRIAPDTDDPKKITADLRVLPLLDGTDYKELVEMSGDARVGVPEPEMGVRAVVGIGRAAKLRQELAGLASGALGRHGFQLDFLGDWAMVGIADRNRLTTVAQKLRIELPQAPEGEPTKRVDEIVEAARIPAYAAVEIRSPSAAALALAAVRKMADETLRGMLVWKDAGTDHGTTIFRVAVGPPRENAVDDPNERSGFEIYYALTDKAFVVSLDEGVLRGLVSDLAEGRQPVVRTGGSRNEGAQVVFDLKPARDGGLQAVIQWLLAEELVRASAPSRAHAEALLRGAPELAHDAAALRALSFAYFGAVPVAPYGGSYTLEDDGVTDPFLGSASSPRWPDLNGTTVSDLVASWRSFRSEIAFDAEGDRTGAHMQSLHVRAALRLDP